MTFEQTLDLGLVRKILTEPRCWRQMTSDAAPERESFRPQARGDLAYIVARNDAGKVMALFLLMDRGGPVEVHFCYRPEFWGRARTVAIGKAFLEWVWANTRAYWLVGPVPAHNRLALRLAEACGFQPFATEKDAVTRSGRQYDRILMSVHRPLGPTLNDSASA
jgi:RimJ/RimL family protein N-acetyltransferase